VPKPVLILHRDGQRAYDAQCATYIQPDLNDVAAGQIWIGDHHQFDFWIRHRDKWVRPWVTAWMDMKSRCIVGWHLSSCPNQTTVLISMRAGIEKYGPPDGVKIDNGKDYDSQMFTGITKKQRKAGYLDEFLVSGIYGMMNISVSFAIPYNAKAKPIERLFATAAGQFSKTIPTYCGKDTQSRPEELKWKLEQQSVIDIAYNFESLAEVFGRWVQAYNNTAHSGAGMEGRSPNQVMNMRLSKRVISSDILDMLMCIWSGKLKVGKNGIRFKGLLYGQYEPRLLQQFGRIVRVAYNPSDLRCLTVYDSESLQRLCVAQQNQLVKYGQPIGEETLREAMAQKTGIIKAHRNWLDKQNLQHLDLTDLTIKALNEASAPAASCKALEARAGAKTAPTLRPVKTPLDLHLAQHLQEKKQRILRLAAGAENTRVIDIDLSSLTNHAPQKREKLNLFEK
jgi:transposase InsO family protein